MNNLVLIGRVKEPLEVKKTQNGISYGQLVLEVDKGYLSEEGTVKKDAFQITVWRNLVESVTELKTDDLVAIRAHLVSNNYDKGDGDISYRAELVAEKVTCLL